MNTSSAASAPHCAPDTGASTIDAPRAATAAAVSRVSHGSDDEVSTSKAPARRPAAMPSAAEHRVAHHAPVGQHGEHHVGTACGVVRAAARDGRAMRRAQPFERRRCDVEALHAMAGLAEVARHRHAHHAEADEADGQRR